jgi:DNA-binding CsgD family transcriptional regulator
MGPGTSQERGSVLRTHAPAATPLTLRECEVLKLLSRGLTASAIGRRLGIAPATARKHLQNVYNKIGVHDRLLAVEHVRVHDMVDDGGGSEQEWRPALPLAVRPALVKSATTRARVRSQRLRSGSARQA